jgi:hypothetical protein
VQQGHELWRGGRGLERSVEGSTEGDDKRRGMAMLEVQAIFR